MVVTLEGKGREDFVDFGSMTVTQPDIDAWVSVLGAPSSVSERSWLWNIRPEGAPTALVVNITTAVPLDGESVTVVSAQTQQGYIELHDVTGYLCIEPDEVLFIAKRHDRFSSLVIGRTGTCSSFANIPSTLLNTDFDQLDPAVLMAALQLSLAEQVVERL